MQDIVKDFGATDVAPSPVVMDDYNSDWDSLYPFSSVSFWLGLCSLLQRLIDTFVVLDPLQGPVGRGTGIRITLG